MWRGRCLTPGLRNLYSVDKKGSCSSVHWFNVYVIWCLDNVFQMYTVITKIFPIPSFYHIKMWRDVVDVDSAMSD